MGALRLAGRFVNDLAAAVLAAGAVLLAWRIAGGPWLPAAATAIGAGLLWLLRPFAARVTAVKVIAGARVAGLPAVGARARRAGAVRWTVALGSVAGVLVTLAGWRWPAAELTVVALAALCAVTLRAWQVVRRQRATLDKIATKIAKTRPQFAIYNCRPRGSAYQIAMWKDLLAASVRPGIVVVRQESALRELQDRVPWPVVLCPRSADLEAVLAPTLRTVFYVNSVARNTDMVAWRGPRHIYLGHGDSDKALSSSPSHAMFDEIWVAGRHSIDRYAAAGVVIEPAKFVAVSRPQLAALRDPDPNEPQTALYAPTWDGYNSKTRLSSLREGERIVADLIGAGLRVVFRPHALSRQTRAGRKAIRRIEGLLRDDARRTGAEHQWGKVASAPGFVTVASIAHVLVTDPSSVVVDFLATGRPIVVIRPRGDAEAPDAPVTGLDARVLEGVYVVPSSLTGFRDEVRVALGEDPRAGERAVATAAVLGEKPAGGWDGPWRDQLARVLGPAGDQ
ncbi:CDP-glycerol glycerophosphotransferase family protein [Rarobacter incanus]|uniref:CDP-glycerol:poly(Glycerophosphate) glycerophosphotransferase n=1 Tax=Rarobacter incanus TaxID=153494 RepID=A0A542SQS7_9MICO|nr:CDP-glycerol glycerophosphotransferase family protein [Rarobacter incanus]TQK76976.1 CDP-glycerol:poly(glycerophosphate) glycerophosphotransferase [Rarobacter incanus]